MNLFESFRPSYLPEKNFNPIKVPLQTFSILEEDFADQRPMQIDLTKIELYNPVVIQTDTSGCVSL